MTLRWLTLVCLLGTFTMASAQDTPKNWFNLDLKADGVPGLSTEKTYQGPLKGKKGRTVIVAVIDSGMDYNHEDLKAVMWTNPGEIPGNGIDDDGNGYVDDVNGWNFIGGANGENVGAENLEVTRLYVQLKAKYEGKDRDKLSKKEKAEYDTFREYERTIQKKREGAKKNSATYEAQLDAFRSLVEAVGKPAKDITADDLRNFKSDDQALGGMAKAVAPYLEQGETMAGIISQLEGAYNYFHSQYAHHYNPEFDARHIVGDNPENTDDRRYGNPDAQGPDAQHGTHVGGIIGAIRGNGIGMDGVADNVRIMSIRAVPDGDERDKDIANAIRYAVDNGAQVINMSFGKGASPQKAAVDAAVRYAMKHDVLLVHAAGNDGKELQYDNNFPNKRFAKKRLFGPRYADNWLEVGAVGPQADDKLAAPFSNYSKDKVDVFAPGVEIYAPVPGNQYENLQGTSMAAPMVSGVAAVLRSHFPELTAKQVRDIIMESTVPYTGKVVKPGTKDEMVPFSDLSVTGGMVNLEKAVELASKTKGKKKLKKSDRADGSGTPAKQGPKA